MAQTIFNASPMDFKRVKNKIFYNPNASKILHIFEQNLKSSSFGVEKRNKHIVIYSVKTRVTNKAYAMNKNLQLIFSIIESICYDRKKY